LFQNDVLLPEIPKAIGWCKDSICVGLKRDYCLVKLDDSNPEPRDLFPTGNGRVCFFLNWFDLQSALG